MSYAFKIVKDEHGLRIAEDLYAYALDHIPDGVWQVSGHRVEDAPAYESLSVSFFVPETKLWAMTQTTYLREL